MEPKTTKDRHGRQHYVRMGVMTLFMFLMMYALMYSMVDRFSNVYSNLNQICMAGLMTAPMVIVEFAVMRSMYTDQRLNVLIIGLSLVVGATCWLGIRAQAGVGNEQFLRSMIPHHAGAILMCEQGGARSKEIQRLCAGIIAGQQREIAEMKALLKENN